ncbi:MAG TPA: VOC family protein [Pirellulales bacterium]|jgi:predicted 3-demethylubiquinone-9 3-methyltransferase (glyoxalase superfamily)|nr:VOC family protein [Pirellulales bacterium]
MKLGHKIAPCLWFDGQAEEAANFYTSIFENSKIGKISRYTDAGREVHGRPAGSAMTVAFEIAGQPFTALNGGPQFKFSEAISFQVSCETQDEIDYFWSKLSEGGAESQCGWLKDKFGVSWQIVPAALGELFANSDPQKSARVMQSLLKMKKLDIDALKRAQAG